MICSTQLVKSEKYIETTNECQHHSVFIYLWCNSFHECELLNEWSSARYVCHAGSVGAPRRGTESQTFPYFGEYHYFSWMSLLDSNFQK